MVTTFRSDLRACLVTPVYWNRLSQTFLAKTIVRIVFAELRKGVLVNAIVEAVIPRLQGLKL